MKMDDGWMGVHIHNGDCAKVLLYSHIPYYTPMTGWGVDLFCVFWCPGSSALRLKAATSRQLITWQFSNNPPIILKQGPVHSPYVTNPLKPQT